MKIQTRCPCCGFEFSPEVQFEDTMGHEFVMRTPRVRHCTVCFLEQRRKDPAKPFHKPQRLCSYMQHENEL